MTQFVSPGVYVRELDFSNYVARIAGTVMAIVGAASKGPVGVPTFLSDAGQAKQIFGVPLPTAANRGVYGLHAAYNALNQTSSVYFLRVTDGTEAYAAGSGPAIINNQVIYLANDDAGIVLPGGKLALTLQIRKKSGSQLGADSFNALVRQFGAKNLFSSTYAPINSLTDLTAAITAGGAFAQVMIPMAATDFTFGTVDQFVSRFNRLQLDGVFRMEKIVQTDSVNGTKKFILLKTQNLSDLLAQNFELRILDEETTSPASPAGVGYAAATFDGGHPNSQIHYVAKQPGLIGNGITVVVQDVGNTFVGLPAVTVSGYTLTVSIDAGVTLAADVINAINGSSAARLLITASNAGASTGAAMVNVGTSHLTMGGANLPATVVSPVAHGIGTVSQSGTWTSILNTSGLHLNFKAFSPGEYANAATVSFGTDSAGLYTIQYQDNNSVIEKAIALRIQPAGSNGSFIDALAGFTNLAADTVADYTLFTDTGSLNSARGGIDVITITALKTFLTWNAYEFYSTSPITLTGGLSGIPDDYNDLVDSVIGNSADSTGLYGFSNREKFDNFYLAAPGFDQSAVIRTGLAIAETAGDMVYVVDGPGGTDLSVGHTVPEIVDWHNGQALGNSAAFNSSYGALYHAWQQIFDNFNGVNHFVPPSVVILEQFAFSENVGEKWFAKAGFKRGRITRSQGGQSASDNNQGDRDYMYSNGNAVNPIVNFLREGPTIFGQRTLQRAASALDRLNVRDLLNFVKRSSAAAVRVDLFEPNDSILLAQITKLLTPIFSEIRSKRGLNKFEVKFDNTTTTDLNRDNNEVVGYIVIEPTKAAEKIILNFVVTAQGASFSEALAAAGVV